MSQNHLAAQFQADRHFFGSDAERFRENGEFFHLLTGRNIGKNLGDAFFQKMVDRRISGQGSSFK